MTRGGMGTAWARGRPTGGVRGSGFRIESGMTEGRGRGNRAGTGHPTRLDAIPASGKRGRCATLKNGFLGFAVLRCASHRCARNDDVGGWIPDPVRNDRGAGAWAPRGHGDRVGTAHPTGGREGVWIPDQVRNDRGAGAWEPRGHGSRRASRCHTGIRKAVSLRNAEERVPRLRGASLRFAPLRSE